MECRQCGLVYVSPRPRAEALIFDGPNLGGQPATLLDSRNLADIEECWEMPLLRRKEDEYPAMRLNHADVLDLLSTWARPPGRLLDFGCGGGFFLGSAKECGWEAYGLEPLAGHAVYARGRFGAQVVTDTLREDTFPPCFFDVITAFQVFEHLPDPVGNLSKLCRFLKPGGAILVEVPNIATWSVRLLRGRHRHFVLDHLYFFSAATLTRLFEQHGIGVVKTYYPDRRMSLRHLLVDWGGRYLPAPLVRVGARAAKRVGILEKTVSVNVGDIVAVVGRKRDHVEGD